MPSPLQTGCEFADPPQRARRASTGGTPLIRWNGGIARRTRFRMSHRRAERSGGRAKRCLAELDLVPGLSRDSVNCRTALLNRSPAASIHIKRDVVDVIPPWRQLGAIPTRIPSHCLSPILFSCPPAYLSSTTHDPRLVRACPTLPTYHCIYRLFQVFILVLIAFVRYPLSGIRYSVSKLYLVYTLCIPLALVQNSHHLPPPTSDLLPMRHVVWSVQRSLASRRVVPCRVVQCRVVSCRVGSHVPCPPVWFIKKDVKTQRDINWEWEFGLGGSDIVLDYDYI